MTSSPPMAPRTPSFLRPALGLLAGLGIFVVFIVFGTFAVYVSASGSDVRNPSVTLLGAQLVLNAAGAMAAGFATGRMTVGRSFYTVILLALILSMSSLVPVLRETANAGEPRWYLLARPAVILIGIVIGGALERRKRQPAA